MAKTSFIDGDIISKLPGTRVLSAWLNKVFNHRHDGLDQDGSAPIDYAVDTGPANACAIALTPALTAHIPGLPIYYKVAVANTGATTLAVNGLAPVAIVKAGNVALGAADLKAGQIVGVCYDGGAYQLVSVTNINALWHRHDGGNSSISSPLDYAEDIGTVNGYAGTYTPALAAHVIGMPLSLKPGSTNTGDSTFTPNGLTPKALLRMNGQALGPGDVVQNSIITMMYDGLAYRITSPIAATVHKSDAAALFLAEGWYKFPALPNGTRFMVQWGTTPIVVAAASASLVFPVPFPTACLAIVDSILNNSDEDNIRYFNYTAVGCDLLNVGTGAGTGADTKGKYIAIGY
jgi:hypothetical protein